MNKILLSLTLGLCCFSCTPNNNGKANLTADFHFEIIDSLQIDYLGNLWLVDYDPLGQNYLAGKSRQGNYNPR